ncbi:MAG: 16S rRNA processing protein RimM [Tannerellaceae bacterium]|jgi:16S rRNA processing protein RimM|nr:16S rRNA processing protein RimM [Tannerellaceae bacterium]
MIEKATVRKVGYFTKPHGIKGEIGLVLSYDIFNHTDDPFIICEMEGIMVPFFIEEYRNKTANIILVKLETVDSEEAVRIFSHREVYYPLERMTDDVSGAAEDTDEAGYVGYTVSDTIYGELGTITDVDDSTANVLYRIDNKGEELLMPAVEEWTVSVNHEKRHIEVSVPEGLLDLHKR